jgi:hypothetical protein
MSWGFALRAISCRSRSAKPLHIVGLLSVESLNGTPKIVPN